eukprot:6198718-Pleurochrysis_carterae.AAC.1
MSVCGSLQSRASCSPRHAACSLQEPHAPHPSNTPTSTPPPPSFPLTSSAPDMSTHNWSMCPARHTKCTHQDGYCATVRFDGTNACTHPRMTERDAFRITIAGAALAVRKMLHASVRMFMCVRWCERANGLRACV